MSVATTAVGTWVAGAALDIRRPKGLEAVIGLRADIVFFDAENRKDAVEKGARSAEERKVGVTAAAGSITADGG